MLEYGLHEMTMTAGDVTLSDDPEIIGDVVYRFEFKLAGSPQDLEVEVTSVDVEDIQNPIYGENGSPVMMNEADRQKFILKARDYFWKRLAGYAEERAVNRVKWGSV